MMSLSTVPFSGSLTERLAAPTAGGIRLYWLGQAVS